MRYVIVLVVFLGCVGVANALTPLLDSSPDFFSGEWAGTGEQGVYCYLKMNNDGRGLLLIDSGAGDWLGARFHWRNRQQSLDVDKIIPLPTSSQLRIMQLGQFTMKTGLNQSLKLNWNSHSNECNLQKIETTKNHLARARNVMNNLQSSKGAQ